jgi:dihydroneopterin aldolase
MDSIIIEGLEVETIIGVHDWEKNQKQTVVIDLEIHLDITAAAESDDLSQTVGYGDLARSVTSHVSETRFELIESLARSIAELVLKEFKPRDVVVKVSKPGAVPNAANVAVKIERSRQ